MLCLLVIVSFMQILPFISCQLTSITLSRKALLFEKPVCVQQSLMIEVLTIQYVILMEKILLWNIGRLKFKVVVCLCLHLPFEVNRYL